MEKRGDAAGTRVALSLRMKNVLIVGGAVVAGSWLCADIVCAMVFAATRPEAPPPAVKHEVPLPRADREPVRLAGFGDGEPEADDLLACPAGVQVLSAIASEGWPDATIAAVRLRDELAVVQRGDVLLDSPVERVRVDENGIAEVLLRVDGTLVACRAKSRGTHERAPPGGAVPSVISRELADAILRGDRTDAWSGVRVVPYFEKGQPYGFKLYGVASSTEVARLGFRNGDVMRSVNGLVLQNPGDVFQAFPSLKQQSSFDVVILREGRDETIRVEIR